MRLVMALALALCTFRNARADFIDLTFQANLNFEEKSGVQFIDVYVSWNGLGTAPSGNGFAADFVLTRNGGGSVAFSSEGPTSSGLTPTGRIGIVNSLGVSDLRPNSELAFEPLNPERALLNLNFRDPVQIPTTQTLLARLSVDTNSMAPGIFIITPENLSFGTSTNFSSGFGQFTITAVPEPSSLLLTAGITAAGAVLRFRRRVRSSDNLQNTVVKL